MLSFQFAEMSMANALWAVDVAGEKMIGKLQVHKMDGTYEEFDK